MLSFNNTTEQLISPSVKYGSRTAIAIISGLITAIGIPGNILVILTIFRVKKMRSTQNLFLANLAFGDFMNLIWCLPIWVLSIYVPWPFGEFACKYIYSLNQVITTSTVFTMVSVMLDRYRAIVYPFKRKLTLRATLLIIASTWVVSYLIAGLPLAFSFELSKGFWVEVKCVENPKTTVVQVQRVFIFLIIFILPCITVLISVLRIKTALQKNIQSAKKILSHETNLKRIKAHKKMIRILLAILAAFILSYVPLIIFLIFEIADTNSVADSPKTLIIFAFCYMFVFVNSTVNPVILYVLSEDFKKGYLEQLKCCRARSIR